MASRRNRRSPSRSRSRSSGRSSSSGRRRTSSSRRRRAPNPNKTRIKLRRYNENARSGGVFNPEVAPPPSKSTRKVPVQVTISRDLKAGHTSSAFIGCVRVGREGEMCSRGRNPRIAMAAAFRKAAGAVNKRRGGFAALNLAGFSGGGRRRRRRR